MHTAETKDKFLELRLKGHSLANISQAIGVSKTTLIEWNRESQEQLRQLRSAELEFLHDRILQSYAEDFNRLQKFQRGVDEFLGEKFRRAFDYDDVVKLDQIIRQQIRQMRKDIELFGLITTDARNPSPFPPNPKANPVAATASLSFTPRFYEGPDQAQDAIKTVSTQSTTQPVENLTVS
jgi:hypothetical protein